ncbi:hypothetical protein AB0E11_14190 [Streptomyces fradiae]|uniref:hypothetical protein n=1 Tax=Streptomyces fradiae TaxID=1906 RepID=UPI0033F6460D
MPPAPSAPAAEPSADPPDAADGQARTGTATDRRRFDRYGPDPEAVPEEEAPVGAIPSGSPTAAAWEPRGRAAETGADRRVPVLTLGVGLTMMGLGLGFLGMRIRRS